MIGDPLKIENIFCAFMYELDHFTHFKKGFYTYRSSIYFVEETGQSECINVTGKTEDK